MTDTKITDKMIQEYYLDPINALASDGLLRSSKLTALMVSQRDLAKRIYDSLRAEAKEKGIQLGEDETPPTSSWHLIKERALNKGTYDPIQAEIDFKRDDCISCVNNNLWSNTWLTKVTRAGKGSLKKYVGYNQVGNFHANAVQAYLGLGLVNEILKPDRAICVGMGGTPLAVFCEDLGLPVSIIEHHTGKSDLFREFNGMYSISASGHAGKLWSGNLPSKLERVLLIEDFCMHGDTLLSLIKALKGKYSEMAAYVVYTSNDRGEFAGCHENKHKLPLFSLEVPCYPEFRLEYDGRFCGDSLGYSRLRSEIEKSKIDLKEVAGKLFTKLGLDVLH